ncbi:hypothetical protein WDW37_07390 [Bdellovibrionota bacterium FG-1]
METTVANKKEQKAAKKSTHVAIRVEKTTGRLVQQILDQINKKDFGKRVGADAVIAIAIGRVTQGDILGIQETSLSNKDRFERDFARYVAKHGKISRDEYLGKRLNGAIPAEPEPKTGSADLQKNA